MIYAKFYQPSAINPGKVWLACGKGSVLILDGRFAKATHEARAAEWCRKHGFVGWSIHEGRDLAWWHPLVSGDPESVHRAGVSIRRQTVSELTLAMPECAAAGDILVLKNLVPEMKLAAR